MSKYLNKKQKRSVLSIVSLSIVFFLILSSCATVTGGSYYNATAVVPGHPRAIITQHGVRKGEGQAMVRIKRKDADKVSFVVKEEGCKAQSISFQGRKFRGAAAIGNVGFFLYIPLAVIQGRGLDPI